MILFEIGIDVHFLFQLDELEDMEHNLDEILQAFEQKIERHILHTVCFY